MKFHLGCWQFPLVVLRGETLAPHQDSEHEGSVHADFGVPDVFSVMVSTNFSGGIALKNAALSMKILS